MKALELLYNYQQADELSGGYLHSQINEAIKELEAYITNYQGTKRRLDNIVTTLAVLQNENKSLVKTLEKYNEEMIELRKVNQDLLNTVIEAQKVIKNVLEGRKWRILHI